MKKRNLLLLITSLALLFATNLNAQVEYTITKNYLDNTSGSLDWAITQAVASANTGQDVTILFDVPGTGDGALVQLPDFLWLRHSTGSIRFKGENDYQGIICLANENQTSIILQTQGSVYFENLIFRDFKYSNFKIRSIYDFEVNSCQILSDPTIGGGIKFERYDADCHDVVIKDSEFNCAGFLIGSYNMSGKLEIINNDITDAIVRIFNNSANVTITDNLFETDVRTNINLDVSFYGANNWVVTNNEFSAITFFLKSHKYNNIAYNFEQKFDKTQNNIWGVKYIGVHGGYSTSNRAVFEELDISGNFEAVNAGSGLIVRKCEVISRVTKDRPIYNLSNGNDNIPKPTVNNVEKSGDNLIIDYTLGDYSAYNSTFVVDFYLSNNNGDLLDYLGSSQIFSDGSSVAGTYQETFDLSALNLSTELKPGSKVGATITSGDSDTWGHGTSEVGYGMIPGCSINLPSSNFCIGTSEPIIIEGQPSGGTLKLIKLSNYQTNTKTNPFTFDPATYATGQYQVNYTYGACSSSEIITVSSLQSISMTPASGIATSGDVIGLSASEADASYQLYLDGIATGLPVNGMADGSAINFGAQTIEGFYTVKATKNACEGDMIGQVKILSCMEAPSISIQNTTPTINTNFSAPVSTSGLTADCNIISYQFDVAYSADDLDFVDYTLDGTINSGGLVSVNSSTPGLLRIAAVSDGTPISGIGDLIKFNFTQKTCNNSTLELSNFRYNNTINSNLQNGTVTVQDNVAPVPDIATLDDITSVCEVTSLTAPTATDNCAGTISATHNVSLPITAQGTTEVTWTYDDGNGNTSTQTQNVVINDISAPVPDAATLIDITAECEVTSLLAPTATDNCAGSVTATHNITLPVTTQGTTQITWTYNDGNGNITTQTQNIVIDDVTAPVANAATLPDITAQCSVTSLIAPTATDNCSNSVTVTHNASLPITAQGTTVVTWSYDDGLGNISTQTQNIVINDVTAPVAQCKDLTIQLDALGNASITTDQINNGSTDNCNIASLSLDENTFTCADIGANTVTLTVTDDNGNSSTCTATVTVEDNIAPVANVATLADVTGECSVTSLTAPTATDNCAGTVTATHDATLPITAQGTTEVTWTYDDGNGNTSTQTQNVVINDISAPVPNVATLIDITAECEVTSLLAPTATDNCAGTITATHDAVLPITTQGTTVVTWTYNDGNGNITTQTQNIVIDDVTAPVANAATLPDITDECSVASLVAPTATDNCSNSVTVTHNASLPITAQGTTEVTWTYDDGNGNTSTQTQNVIINDVTAPVADVTNLPDITDECSVTSLTAPTATDNCIGTVTATHNTSLPITIQGTTVVTWTYNDGNGNISSQTQNVVIDDVTAPVANIASLPDVNADCEVTSLTAPTATDNCIGTVTATHNANLPITGQGTTVVTWTYDDGNGNTSTQTQNIVLNDITAPVADVASLPNVTAECLVTSLTAPTATDYCTGSVTGTHNASLPITAQGTTVVTWTYVDGNGNTSTQTQNIVIDDVTAPVDNVATLPNITAECSVASLSAPTATDNCIGSVTATHNASLPITTQGTTVVTWTYNDGNDNTSTQIQNVVIDDVTPPTVICQDITIQLDASGNSSITTTQIDNGSTDNCGIQSMALSKTDFTCSDIGNNTVTLTVTDVNGNSSKCDAIVTVQDLIAPIAVCRDVTVAFNASGNASLLGVDIDNGSSDNCSIASMTASPNSFTTTDLGTHTVTLTVTDGTGLQSTCTSQVTLIDNIPPNAIYKDITIQLDASGNATITANDINDNSNDAFGIKSITASKTSFDCTNIGANSVVLTVTDNNDNVATCSAVVTVEDNIVPTAVCKDITVAFDASGNASISGADIDNGSSDNCSVASLSATPNTFTTADIGTQNVTLTVTDGAGQQSTCTSQVTLIDNTPPNAICKDITVQLDASGNATITANDIDNGSNDAFGLLSISASKTNFDCTNVGANAVILTVTDNNDNVATCTATVTVQDNLAPNAICQDITVQLDASGNASITTAQIDNGSSDNCGIQSMALSKTAFTCADLGNNTVILTVTDVYGNSSTCNATVTVEDNIAPVAVCQDITVQLDASGNVSITAAQVDNGSSDNCSIQSRSLSQTNFTCSDIGANSVVLTVTDANGNSSTCNATVTVEDNVAPAAVCKDITVELDASGNASITAADIDNGSSDNCSIASMTAAPNTFTTTDLGTQTVTLTVTDSEGLQSTCTSQVTLVDNTPPNTVCKNITIQLDATGNATITANDINDNSNDAFGIKSIAASKTSFDCTNVGANSVILTVTDNNDNVATCTATVTVQDQIAPTAICKNITFAFDASGNATLSGTDIDNGSSDNCSIAAMTATPNTFTTTDIGTQTVTLTVTDGVGLQSTCTSQVTLIDNILPNAICKDITVQLDASGNASITANDIDDGSNDAFGIQSIVASKTSFDCTNVGANAVVLTVTDNNNNVATCTATVTVEDNIAPTAICQDITVQLDAAGNAGITAAQIDNGSSDNCGIQSRSLSQTSFSCSDIGTNTVTLTVTDVNGNSSTCNAAVTVEDAIAPTAVCKDITVYFDASGNASISASDINDGSSDNCSIAAMAATPNTFTTTDIGTQTVTLTVTDGVGLQSTCTSQVTLVDNTPPNAICKNITIQLDASGNAAITANDIDNGSNDAFGIQSIVTSKTSFDCTNVGANAVVLTVTDNNGNIATCTATVTVQDNIAPIALCKNATIQLDAAGTASITTADIDNGSTDNCSIQSMSLSQSNFTCSNIGENTVTLTVTDIDGNSTSCNAIVTVEDNVAPTAVCRDITVAFNASGNATLVAADVDNGSSDNCSVTSMTVSPNSFTTTDIGTQTVTLTVTDGEGLQSTCTSQVTLIDNIPPNAVCKDITIELDASGNATITASDINDNSNDAFGIKSISASKTNFDCTNIGANSVVLTVTDNNDNVATCTATVTVEDNIAPTAICQDITVQLDASGNASITTAQIDNGSSDNCGIQSMSLSQSNFTCANIGTNTVTLIVTDIDGNSTSCNATVTVEDNVAPTAVCKDITVYFDALGNASITSTDIDNGSSDNCSIATMAAAPNTFTTTDIGTNTVTLTVTDGEGLQATCTSQVTLVDNTPPNAICKNITIQLNASGNATIVAGDINDNSNDAFGIQSIAASKTSFDCTNIGANSVVLTVTDNNDNVATCTATVTVEDLIAPAAICQDITFAFDASGNATLTGTDIDNGSSDNCSIASMTVSPNTFTTTDLGTNTVTLTVTDGVGSQSTCTSEVTLIDNIAPNAICKDITVQLDATGNATITANDIDDGSNDAFGIQSIVASKTNFDCTNVGTNAVVLTVTDNNGNVATCTAIVTVEDNVAPIALYQDLTIQLDAAGNASITTAQINNGSSDNCGIQSIALSQTNFTCAHIGDNTITLTVTDVNSNVSTCNATVTVEDLIAPAAICQDITFAFDASGNATLTGTDIDNGSSDNCSIASMTVSPNTFTTTDLGTHTVTLTVTDGVGLQSTCTSEVTLIDNIAPNAICKDITVQLDATGNATITANDIDNGSNDAFGIQSIVASKTNFDCTNVGANAVVLTVTDNNGNVATCTATVTIEDNVAPIALCQDLTIQLDATGNASITTAQIDNGSSDNCGIQSIALSQADFTCANIGTNTVTLTVTDVNGNFASCQATVTVQDIIAPSAICQDITFAFDASGNATLTGTDIDNGSSDNCSIASMTVSPNTFTTTDLGTHTVTLTVTDGVGLQSTCTSEVTLIDNIAPNAICKDITVQLDATGNATITANDIDNGSNDAFGIQSIVPSKTNFDCTNVGPNSVVLTVTDNNGNVATCTAIVTVEDNIAPTVSCNNLTIQLDANGNASITTAQIDNGSSDNCGIQSIVLSQTNFTCAHTGDNTVTLTVTDVNGNSSACTSTVTVEDLILPIAVCKDITVAYDATGNVTLTGADVDNGSSDNCNIASMTVSPNSFTTTDLGTHTVTLTVTDDVGQQSTCTSQVTLEDITPPEALCENITVYLDDSGSAMITANDIDNGSNDAFGIQSITASKTSFDCTNVGPNSVVLTVTDNNDNVATCTATVTVVDDIAPTVSCNNLTIHLDANGNASITTAQIDNGSSDNCGIQSIVLSQTNFSCAHIGDNTVTMTVTDVNGNVSTCNATVTVEDLILPVAVCKDITVAYDATGNVTLTGADVDNGSSDNCSIASMTVSPNIFTTTDLGTHTVTLTVTDGVGLQSTCTSEVTLIDNIPPNAICKNITIELDATGNASITSNDIDNGSNDAFGIQSIVASKTSFDCTNVGANAVVLTVTDNNGNVSTCTATVTVQDNIAPKAICQDVTIQLDATGNASITTTDIDNGSSDNCGIATTVLSQTSFTCANIGVNEITLTVTDVNGNVSTCQANVTVEDVIAPILSCQTDRIVQTDNNLCTYTHTNSGWDPGITENCTVSSITYTLTGATTGTGSTLNNVVFNKGVTTVEWEVSDGYNTSTCSYTVTVEDNQLPSLICPTTTEIASTIRCQKILFDYTTLSETSDNCTATDQIILTQTPAPGEPYDANTIVTITATDESNNSISCSFAMPVAMLVTNNLDDGLGSLRAAIDTINSCPDWDLVHFDIPGNGPHQINLLSKLPAIADVATIDASTQPGNSTYNIILNGNAVPGETAFEVNSADVLINGMQIEGFAYGISDLTGFDNFALTNSKIQDCSVNAVLLNNTTNSTIDNCELINSGAEAIYLNGTSAITVSNSEILNSALGIKSENSSDVTISGNLISGNNAEGVEIHSSNTIALNSNTIVSNAGDGILVGNNSDAIVINSNSIGINNTTLAGNTLSGIAIMQDIASISIDGNTIADNGVSGIYFQQITDGTNVNISNNYIGTNLSGVVAGNQRNGIHFADAVNVTGCVANTISNNGENGVFIESGSGNTISQSVFNNNGIKGINLNEVNDSWQNDNKKAPFVTDVNCNGTTCTVTVVSEDTDANVELFAAGISRQDALQYINVDPVKTGYITWRATFPDNGYSGFTATSIDADGNTSEIGYEIAMCLEVVTDQDYVFGSLRSAIECANEYPDFNRVWFNLGTATNLVPQEQLPDIYTPVYIDGTTANNLVIDGNSIADNNSNGIHFVEKPDAVIQTGSTVRNVNITNFANGIKVGNHQHFNSTRVNTYLNRQDGYVIDTVAGNVIFNYCNTYENTNSGIKINPIGNGSVTITNTEATLNGENGIFVNNLQDNPDVSLHVSGGTFSDNGISGIATETAETGAISITNSSVLNNAETGADLKASSADLVISNNKIGNNPIAGLNIENADSVRIISNYIGVEQNYLSIDTTYSGIDPIIMTIDTTVVPVAEFPNGYGIKINNLADTAEIINNKIGFNTFDGIYIDNAPAYISQNYIGVIMKFDSTWVAGNQGVGINAAANAYVLVGQPVDYESDTTELANYIGFNGSYGIKYHDGDIVGNFIGSTQFFDSIGNGNSGIYNPAVTDKYIKYNLIGFNDGHGIEGANGAIIEGNIIGGIETGKWGNQGWGIIGDEYSVLRRNTIGANTEGGVRINNSIGKITECLFFNKQPYAIKLTQGGGIQPTKVPKIENHTENGDRVIIEGKAEPNDSIEVFLSTEHDQDAIIFAGKTITDASKNWSIEVMDTTGAWQPNTELYYVATATDVNGNTSELSSQYFIASKCEPCYVINNNDEGPGSLRAAILKANSEGGADTIKFDIPEDPAVTDEYEIQLFSPLPGIEKELFIDGFSQPGAQIIVSGNYVRDTVGMPVGDITRPNITTKDVLIEGIKFTGLSRAIQTYGKIENLEIRNCEFEDSDSSAILISRADNANIHTNTFTTNNGAALTFTDSEYSSIINNSIDNSGLGVLVYNEADSVNIFNNLFENNHGTAVSLIGSTRFNIEENTINNNLNNGILIDSVFNVNIYNNLIGTASTLDSLPNTGHGIAITDKADNINVEQNTIVASGRSGVYVNVHNNVSSIEIIQNELGAILNNDTIGNLGNGIELDTASNVLISENLIVRNIENGIRLNYGTGNTFTKNRIYHNFNQPISLKDTLGNWSNNSILTPSVAHVTYNGGTCNVVIKSRPEYAKIEIFEADSASINAFNFITDNVTNNNNGFWTGTFNWTDADNLNFTATVTDVNGNTSELGMSCLIVTNTNNAGMGSLRDAIECANYDADFSNIVFDMTYLSQKTIKPLSQLPSIYNPVKLAADMSDSIIISGINSPASDGLVFTGGSISEQSEVSGLIIEGYKNGVKVDGGNNLHIDNLIIRDNSQNGIVVSSDMDSLRISNSRIYSNDSCGVSVHEVATSFIEINSNEINNNSRIGVLHKANSDSTVIINNAIYSNASEGIYTPEGTLDFIANNYIYGNTLAGIKVENTQIEHISSNTIGTNSETALNTPNETGLEILGDNVELISGNEIVGNNESGIFISSQNTVLRNNYIGLLKNYTPLGNGSHGISGEFATNLIIDNNYIGNNIGDGIWKCENSIVINNKIGGTSTSNLFGNEGAGMRGGLYDSIYRNTFADNALGGLVLNTTVNKISECLFYGFQPRAIDLPEGAQEPASFLTGPNDYETRMDTLVIRGNSVNTDSIEFFFSNGQNQSATRFIGRIQPEADGTWEYKIPSGTNYNYYGANHYVNTATNADKNTSELSDSLEIMFTLCYMQDNGLPFLSDKDRDSTSICFGDYKRINGKFNHLTYTWTHHYAPGMDSLYSESMITEFQASGLFTLHVEDPLGCQVTDSLYLEQLMAPIKTDFLMASEAGLYDKVVIVETSFPEPDSVKWNFRDASVEFVDGNYALTYVDTGYHEVTLTAYKGTCDSTITRSIYIGEESRAYTDGFVYPNKIISVSGNPIPVATNLTVSIVLSEVTDLSISIHNNTGYKLIEEDVSNSNVEFNHNLNFSDYLPGVYYVVVTDNQSDLRVIKVVKE